MERICRLCAEAKQPTEFRCRIDDLNLNLEQKLIGCCNWNSFQQHENLPKSVCISCFQRLNQCWDFHEYVTHAQRKLLELIKNDNLTIPVTPQKVDCDDTCDNVIDSLKVEEIKVEIAPEEWPTAIFLHEISVGNIFGGDETNEIANNIVDLEDTNENIENVKIRKLRDSSGSKIESSTSEPMNNRENKTIEYSTETNEFDILKHFSLADVNPNGTIKAERIREENLFDWTVMKNQCYRCDEHLNDYGSLSDHFKKIHPTDKLKCICSLCPDNGIIMNPTNYISHVTNAHYPHLFYW